MRLAGQYAQIEKEALATTWSCERFSMYLLGKQFTIETEHKPLVPLLRSKLLEEIPVRIQWFHMRLMKFKYSIIHDPGKQLIIADTLSHAPRKYKGNGRLQKEAKAYIVCQPDNGDTLTYQKMAAAEVHFNSTG